MGEILFASDLDNTLLFSHRHKMDSDYCVEWLEEKEQGFITPKTLDLLPLVQKKTRFIPVTSRSVAQYQRIVWPESCVPSYAVVANGGILLVNGEVDLEWSTQMYGLVAPWQRELRMLQDRLSEVPMLKHWKMVDGVYLYAVCEDSERAQASKKCLAGKTELDIAVSGRKVYFFPPPVNKGAAVNWLKTKFQPEKTICAGDSVIDGPMLCAADVAIVPEVDILEGKDAATLRIHRDAGRFPDFVLACVLREMLHTGATAHNYKG